MKILTEFKDFLKEYKVIGLAVALVIGLASVALVNAFVKDLLMPIITFFYIVFF